MPSVTSAIGSLHKISQSIVYFNEQEECIRVKHPSEQGSAIGSKAVKLFYFITGASRMTFDSRYTPHNTYTVIYYKPLIKTSSVQGERLHPPARRPSVALPLHTGRVVVTKAR